MGGSLTLITGGARSGKSTYAIAMGEQSEGRVVYIATAQAGDADMAQRIERHRSERPAEWMTIEEPRHISTAIRGASPHDALVIVDCLTMWVANLLLDHFHDVDAPLQDELERADHDIRHEIADLCALPAELTLDLLVVTNEVGSGVVPPYAAGRAYRDLLGTANQLVARAADRVVLLVAGLPLEIKAP
ncbi:MAG: bifunctional adenosylcobinamide kinase/adenosylcobinamide-phosphate guanylyltransferase [Dehalococcoidia bacterium]|nr:bifunctional adenosylcobinamide kinase/adenosylcobinamide-phosphate guanylyltransferase [Dehalococcoidia bacterium]